jgi:hypothetical protein
MRDTFGINPPLQGWINLWAHSPRALPWATISMPRWGDRTVSSAPQEKNAVTHPAVVERYAAPSHAPRGQNTVAKGNALGSPPTRSIEHQRCDIILTRGTPTEAQLIAELERERAKLELQTKPFQT